MPATTNVDYQLPRRPPTTILGVPTFTTPSALRPDSIRALARFSPVIKIQVPPLATYTPGGGSNPSEEKSMRGERRNETR